MTRYLIIAAIVAAVAMPACTRNVKPDDGHGCLPSPILFDARTKRVTRFLRAQDSGEDESCRLVCGHISVDGELTDEQVHLIVDAVMLESDDPVTHLTVTPSASDAGAGGASVFVDTGVGCGPLEGEGRTHVLRNSDGWKIVSSTTWSS